MLNSKLKPGDKLRCVDSTRRESVLRNGATYTFQRYSSARTVFLKEIGKVAFRLNRFVLIKSKSTVSPIKRVTNVR